MPDEDEAWITPSSIERLSGEERFTGLEASVREFWRFALGDPRMNNARGYLAEFLVARALAISNPQRIEWAEYDVLLDDIRIEVKSSAYLQAWEQRHLSRITFSGLKGTPYNPRSGYDPAGRQYNAEVYVFGVQTALTHDAYDPLDVSQWEWYVLPRSVLAHLGQATISLTTLRAHTHQVELQTLEVAVRAAASADREPPSPHPS
ncbi:hypothetical protein [Amnibacterium endophyticum]|uniref:PD-(D/E)XK endonuclease-like domain-containing protein n=1 Tax=Amnibacterium endophyticum TaxID=2109337 RepID=A0ABW4LFW5_9MICO